ncbi:ABC transporter ATP-binding protein [Limnohabitans planktonicus]|uniref:ABC transporter n=1 Tax=Limnohabitans planktonicus II-D5 TaxID=1293045 RepID=A0A2T7UC24_9BURK|nr:ABC transporter ATP-binding protein [Limnohabitans planktonicus]PVE42260.1 ABC transporter [Limnohabitans planktonicus II-D5]
MTGLQVQLRSSSPIRLEAEFDCGAGELVALVGPSGSGKTSMLRAIAGLWTPADVQGHIRVAGQAWLDTAAGVQLSPQQRRAGLVFQHYALFPHMTAQANVALAAGPGWTGADVHALLSRLGLATLSQRRPSQLSGGQQQRVALARALVRVMPTPSLTATRAQAATPEAWPGVLLLDEPFSAVDAPTRQTLYRELAALRQKVSVPMVLVTHDLAEARRLADRVVIVDAGQTLQTGEPSRVFASPRNARVAELVGIQNHFEGRFFKAQSGWGRLRWTDATQSDLGLDLAVFDKNKIDDGTPVTWVLNGEQVDVMADNGLLSAAEPGHTRLRCQLLEVLSLGEISLCTLRPEALPSQTITLNLTTRLLGRLQAQAGGWVQLLIAPQALHIMPVRTGH